jgi:hypothetical protein
MRITATVLLLAAMLLGTASAKGKPQPVPCPPDVGVALAEACPCAGKMMPNGTMAPWKNHGQYQSCMVHLRNALRKSGCLTDDERRSIARCAARSTCGKDTVLCCHYELGACSDPMPGDMVAAGTCNNQSTVACDVSDDCTVSTSGVVRDATMCAADGGVVVEGGGSVCTPCPPLPTTTTTTTLP